MPAEDAQEAAQSKRGLSKGFFLKPKERKAKTKKAQAAGQTAQVSTLKALIFLARAPHQLSPL